MSHLQYSAYTGVGERNLRRYGHSQAVRVGDRIECGGQGAFVITGTSLSKPSAHLNVHVVTCPRSADARFQAAATPPLANSVPTSTSRSNKPSQTPIFVSATLVGKAGRYPCPPPYLSPTLLTLGQVTSLPREQLSRAAQQTGTQYHDERAQEMDAES
jgi:hypothetical protein